MRERNPVIRDRVSLSPPEYQENSDAMKLLTKFLSTAFTLLLILLVLLAYGSINNRWYRVITVEGNSMAPILRYGDMIVVTPPDENIPVYSIVVINIEGHLVTHRIIGYDANHLPITKGDANESADNFTNPALRIVGVYRFCLPGFGYPILWLSSLFDKT